MAEYGSEETTVGRECGEVSGGELGGTSEEATVEDLMALLEEHTDALKSIKKNVFLLGGTAGNNRLIEVRMRELWKDLVAMAAGKGNKGKVDEAYKLPMPETSIKEYEKAINLVQRAVDRGIKPRDHLLTMALSISANHTAIARELLGLKSSITGPRRRSTSKERKAEPELPTFLPNTKAKSTKRPKGKKTANSTNTDKVTIRRSERIKNLKEPNTRHKPSIDPRNPAFNK